MPSNSLISFLLAAVGLRSNAKSLSRWVNCSGVTRDRLRFSLPSGGWVEVGLGLGLVVEVVVVVVVVEGEVAVEVEDEAEVDESWGELASRGWAMVAERVRRKGRVGGRDVLGAWVRARGRVNVDGEEEVVEVVVVVATGDCEEEEAGKGGGGGSGEGSPFARKEVNESIYM